MTPARHSSIGYADRSGIRLLKALCQSEPTKILSWHTATPILQRRDVPTRFSTSSRVALIGNDWKTLNADVAALEDRGHVLVFEPGALEVHHHAAGWFWDQEIFDFVAGHLHRLGRHSLRMYTQAWELKQAGLDWRQAVLGRFLTGPALMVARLKTDPHFTNEAARVSAFIRSGAGCRATYFRYARRLQPPGPMPSMRLTVTSPPTEAVGNTDYFEQLRKRFGHLGNG